MEKFFISLYTRLLFVRSAWWCSDWIKYGLKCLITAPIAVASTSESNQVSWCPYNLSEKWIYRIAFSLSAYIMAPILFCLTESSVTICNRSAGWSIWIVLTDIWCLCAAMKASRKLSDQSLHPMIPFLRTHLSKGAKEMLFDKWTMMTPFRTLYAAIN